MHFNFFCWFLKIAFVSFARCASMTGFSFNGSFVFGIREMRRGTECLPNVEFGQRSSDGTSDTVRCVWTTL